MQWESRASLPNFGRHAATSFEINGKIYVGLGRRGDGVYMSDFWEYNPQTDIWTQKASYPGGARFIPTGFSINGKGYICLGYTSGGIATSNLYEYDPNTDMWTAKTSFPGGARYGASAFVIGDTAYVGTGTCGGTSCHKNDFWMYVPSTNAWTQKANFPGGNSINVLGFSIGSKGYFGNTTTYSTGTYSPSNNFWEYNPSTNTWSSIASMPGSARRITSAFVYSGDAYVGCGTNSGSPVSTFLNDFYVYSPGSNSWSYQTSNSSYRSKIDTELFCIGDSTVFSVGGYSSSGSHSNVWQLKLNSDTCDYYDTTFINDTTFISIYDTTFTTVFDTSNVIINDTIYTNITTYDTTFTYQIDTIYQTIFDTVTTYINDTVYHYVNVAVEDTLIVNLYDPGCGNIQHKIYPNPSSDFVYLSSNSYECYPNAEVEFINALGQILQTHPYNELVTIDVRGYARSTYLLRLKAENGSTIFAKKIVIK
ncbi:MAG: hypothetical protein COA58_04830 [Bacteroidetes bacterium]|nr:MAG: hypothetical protein COA58_04830 [Bacteroidota bacterium]